MKIFILHIVFLLVVIGYASAEIFTVEKNGKLKSIKRAIELANPGDTILVGHGIYKEGNYLIQKSIALIGKNLPILDGENKGEIFTIAAKNVTIEGFHLKNSGRSSMEDLAGIKGLDAHHIIIRNNRLENTFFGIHLSNTNYSTIENNHLQASAEHEYQLGNGIHLWKCTNALIIGNEVKGHRDGIYFEFVTNSSVKSNKSISNMRYGLHFMFSHDDDYEDNIFSENGAGVAVMYSRNVKMIRNRFEKNWGSSSYGMLLKDIRDSEVLYNQFLGNTVGIYMEGTSRIKFESNEFKENGWAVKLLASCDDNTFSNNNFKGNTFDMATNGSRITNQINNNYWDKYQGYDLNKDGIGDVAYHPVSMFSVIVEKVPSAIMLWRSFLVYLLDRSEKMLPAITPKDLKDDYPNMKPYDFN